MSTRPATANDQLAWPASPRTAAMTKGRQADSARRRQRVIAALNKAASDGTEISVSGIARAAGVDRAFFYRRRAPRSSKHRGAMPKPARPRSARPRPAVTGPAVLRPAVAGPAVPRPGEGAAAVSFMSGGFPAQISEFTSDEVAAALVLSGQSAERLLGLALDLALRLPGTSQAQRAGLIDVLRAPIIADATQMLDADRAARAEALVLPKVANMTGDRHGRRSRARC